MRSDSHRPNKASKSKIYLLCSVVGTAGTSGKKDGVTAVQTCPLNKSKPGPGPVFGF